MSSEQIKILKLGELAKIKGGKRMPAGTALTSEKSNHPYLRIVDFKDGSIDRSNLQYVPDEVFPAISRYIISSRDLYISIVGTIGLVGKVPEDLSGANLTENAAKICDLDESRIDKNYLGYYLRSEAGQGEIKALAVGSTQPKLALFRIEQINVPCPPLSAQRRIASLLGALDDRITLLRETNATLEAIAQALFKSWFVDFDPVHANIAAKNQPEGAVQGGTSAAQGRMPAAALDAATAALFPDSFEESELGLVPRGWRMLPLDEAYEINPSRKLKKGELAPYLDMASVGTQGHVVSGVVDREMGSGTKFINGDTLLARITPCLENGKSAFVDFLAEDQTGWGSTEFVVLRPKKPLPPYHGYLLARHPAFREHAIQSMSGTSGRQRVQNDVLGRYLVVVPGQEIAAAFGGLVGGLQSKIAANHEQAQTLTQLRDTLLPRLISGQLCLPEAEAMCESLSI